MHAPALSDADARVLAAAQEAGACLLFDPNTGAWTLEDGCGHVFVQAPTPAAVAATIRARRHGPDPAPPQAEGAPCP